MKFFVLIFAHFYFGLADIDWCSKELSCGGKQHTICKYGCETSKSVQGCKKSKGMTDNVRNQLLKAHNQLRNKIALGEDERVPYNKRKAANMMALSYDTTIEHTAECWINQCTFAHDKCRKVPGRSVGQNLGIYSHSADGSCTAEVLLGMIENGWYGKEIGLLESLDQIYEQYNSGNGWGHYTQVIWAKTSLIGCAAAEFISPDNGMESCLLGCNYGSAGNMLSTPIYEVGDPASQCPEGLKPNPTFKGLCGEIKEYGGQKHTTQPKPDKEGPHKHTTTGSGQVDDNVRTTDSGMSVGPIEFVLLFSSVVNFVT